MFQKRVTLHGQSESPLEPARATRILRAETWRSLLPIGLLLAGIGIAIHWVSHRPLAWDEIEFFRATDWVAKGEIPYRDFWEHHSPLQWFVYAPLHAWLPDAAGASSVILLRWLQVPLWILTLWLWIRAVLREVPQWCALTPCSLLLLSPAFLLFAVEYRVDALASGLFVVGLLLGRTPGRVHRIVLGGLLLGFVPLANLRLGPQAFVCLVALGLIDTERRTWRVGYHTISLFTGALAALTITLGYFVATGSLAQAWQQLIVDNHLVAELSPSSSRAFWSLLGITLSEFDPIPILLITGGLISAVRCLVAWRHPGLLQICALLFLVNLGLVYSLNAHYFYHFQTLLLLSLPLVAELLRCLDGALQASARVRLAAATLAFWTVGLHIFGMMDVKEARRLECQDELVRAVHRLTRPEETVWDGSGFALERAPAYPYWFLPMHVRLLAKSGRLPPLTPDQLQSTAPAAIVLHARTINWLREWPQLADYVHENYLPVRSNLWLPAPSGRFASAGEVRTWRILRRGTYKLTASTQLASHPFFEASHTGVDATERIQSAAIGLQHIESSRSQVPLTAKVNGRPIAQSPPRHLDLDRGDLLEIRSDGREPLGVFLVPLQVSALIEPSRCASGPDAPLYSYF